MYSFHGSVPPEKPNSLTPAPPVEGALNVWLGPCGWLCLASRMLNKLEQMVVWGEVDSPVLIPRHPSPCSSEMWPRQCSLHTHCEQSSLPANTVVQRQMTFPDLQKWKFDQRTCAEWGDWTARAKSTGKSTEGSWEAGETISPGCKCLRTKDYFDSSIVICSILLLL